MESCVGEDSPEKRPWDLGKGGIKKIIDTILDSQSDYLLV